MFNKFFTTYNVSEKPIAYIGDNTDLDGEMARNANLNFIQFNPSQSIIDMREFFAELNTLKERRVIVKKRWDTLLRHRFLTKDTETNVIVNFQDLPAVSTTTSSDVLAEISESMESMGSDSIDF